MRTTPTLAAFPALAGRLQRGLLAAGALLGGAFGTQAQCDGSLPYASNFPGGTLPGCYTIIDANADGYTWGAANVGAFTNASVAHYNGTGGMPDELTPDDWLITPALATVEGSTYRLKYNYQAYFGSSMPVAFKVHAGASATVAGLGQLLQDHGMVNVATVLAGELEFVAGEGPLHIGFHVHGHSMGYNMGFRVGDITLEEVLADACELPAPSGVSVSALQPTSATLEWDAVAGAYDHEYELRTEGAAGSGATGLVASGASASTSVVISSGIAPNTTYRVYLRARCGDEDPSGTWSAAVVFHTPCAPVGLPFAQGFSDAGSFACFTSQNLLVPEAPNDHPYWVRATNNWSSYGFTGASAGVFQGIGFAPDAWLFLPAMELEAGVTYRLAYNYGKAGNVNASRFAKLAVWYGTERDGNAMGTTGTLLVDHGAFTHGATPHAITFTPSVSGVYHVGFHADGPVASSTWTVVDDLELDVAPACATPENVVATPATEGLQLSWTCTDCTGEVLVEYGLSSLFTTPGAGAGAGANGTVVAATGSPFLLGGLVPGASYRLFLRQQCDEGFGYNSAVVTATVQLSNGACDNAVDIACGDAVSANTTGAPITTVGFCDAHTANTRGVWYAVTGDGSDVTLSTCPADGGQAGFSTLISVFLSDDCVEHVCVARSEQSSGCASLTWTTEPDAYYFVYVSGHAGTDEAGDFTLAVSCTDVPSCFQPAGVQVGALTAGSAELTWNGSAYNTGSAHAYELRTAGAPGSGNTGLVVAGTDADGAVEFSGLEGSTTYTFAVRADCGDDGFSAWSTISFTTPCTAVNVPYDAAFAGAALPDCYQVVNANDDDWTWVGASTTGFTNGNVAVYNNFDGFSATPDDWLITRGINTVAGRSYRISLKHKLNIGFAAGAVGLQVYAGPDADRSTMTLLQDLGNVASNVVTPRTVDFVGDGGVLYLGFKAGANTANSGWSFALFLGDLHVDALDCEGTLNGSVLPGSPCDAGVGFVDGVVNDDCVCVGTAVVCEGTELNIGIRTNAPEEVTFEVLDASGAPVLTAGPFEVADVLVNTTVCLPANGDGPYSLRILDAAGDGLGDGGYWEVTDTEGRLLLRDAFPTGNVSPIANAPAYYGAGHALEVQPGSGSIAAVSCGDLGLLRQSRVFADEVPGASQYQFEFADPDAGFRRRIAVPRNWVRISEMVTAPLGNGVTYFARVRADLGAPGFVDDAFGAGCEVGLLADPSCTRLVDDEGQPTHSCGVTRTFGGSSKVWATHVSGATQYRFRFSDSQSGFVRVIDKPNVMCALNWVTLPLVPGTTYDVDVQVFVNGAWTGYCGPTCQLTIAGAPAPAMPLGASESLAATRVDLWPNPAHGDHVRLRGELGAAADGRLLVELIAPTGQVVRSMAIVTEEGRFDALVDIAGLPDALYLVRLSGAQHVEVLRFVRGR